MRRVMGWFGGGRRASVALAVVGILAAGCSRDASLLRVATPGGRLAVREVMTIAAREPPYAGPIVQLAWSNDGSRIASAGFGEGDYPGSANTMLWDAASGRRLASIPRAEPLEFDIGFTADSRLLVMAAAWASDGPRPVPKPEHLSLIDARTGAVVRQVPNGLPPPPPGGAPRAIAVAPIGSRAAAAFTKGFGNPVVMVLYDFAAPTDADAATQNFRLPWTGADLISFDPRGVEFAALGYVPFLRQALSGTGTTSGIAAVLSVHDAFDGKQIWSRRLEQLRGIQSMAWGGRGDESIIVLGLGSHGLTGEIAERVVALDGATGRQRWVARWANATIESLAFSPDGNRLAAVSRGREGREVRILDSGTGETLAAIGGALREPRAIAWGPRQPRQRLAFNDGGRIRVVEIDQLPQREGR